MEIMSLINALPGAVAQGLIWGIMAIGVYLTFRILNIADLTVDGTMCTGGAVYIMMLMSGHNIWVSMLASTGAGMLAGLVIGKIFWNFALRLFSVALGSILYYLVLQTVIWMGIEENLALAKRREINVLFFQKLQKKNGKNTENF